MKLTSVQAPTGVQQQTFQTGSGIKPDVRAKVIAMIQEGAQPQTQQEPQRQPENHSINPNNVSPEELSAVKSNTQTQEVIEQAAEVEAPLEEKKPDPQLSKQFAQLARQEKALRAKAQQQEQQFKLREAELRAKEAELQTQSGRIPQGYISIDDLKNNTLGTLDKYGIPVNYDEVTQRALNPVDPRTEALIARQEARIAQLEAKLEDTSKAQIESQQQAYQAAVKQIRTDVKNLVQMDPAFETVKAAKAVDDVVELITETYNKDGILLSVEDAAQQVEDYLVEEALKLTRIGKIKSKLEQSSAQRLQADKKTQATQEQKPQMKTLTNATSSTRKLSARERAMLAFKGELKS